MFTKISKTYYSLLDDKLENCGTLVVIFIAILISLISVVIRGSDVDSFQSNLNNYGNSVISETK